MRKSIKNVLVGLAGAGIVGAIALGGTAYASSTSYTPPVKDTSGYACAEGHVTLNIFTSPPRCTPGQTMYVLGAKGATGANALPIVATSTNMSQACPADGGYTYTEGTTSLGTICSGAPGKDGTNGTNGTNGESLVSQTAIPAATVATGGSFSANKTDLVSVAVPNGTYRVNIEAKVANVSGQTAEVYPLIAVYDGAPLSDFSNDLFNLGEGALPAISNIDQYINGSEVVTVKNGTVNVIGFGYDSDRGAGSYTFEGGTVTITRVS